MRRVQLTPTCRSALAAHQRDANAQAGTWVARELRRELEPGRYDVTVSISGEELRAERKPIGYGWRTIGDVTQVWPLFPPYLGDNS